MQRRMGAIRMAQGVLAVLGLASACQAQPGEIGHAWFVRNLETKQWCAFVDEARAALAAEDERFDWSESSWLKYGEDRPLTLLVALQSEDAYVEDSYSFGPDLGVTEVVRKGHYIDDPFFTATYRRDGTGKLRLTPESIEAGRNWNHTTYFLEWPMYGSIADLPFAAQIETTPRVSVSANC